MIVGEVQIGAVCWSVELAEPLTYEGIRSQWLIDRPSQTVLISRTLPPQQQVTALGGALMRLWRVQLYPRRAALTADEAEALAPLVASQVWALTDGLTLERVIEDAEAEPAED